CLGAMTFAKALPPARPLREHRDHVAVSREPDGGLDRLPVGPPPVNLERARRDERRPEREPEELRLRHEAEEPPRPEAEAERPRIEVRHVAGRQDEAALRGQVLAARGAIPEGEAGDRPGNGRDRRVERGGAWRTWHRRRVSRKRVRTLGWRATNEARDRGIPCEGQDD